MIHRLSAILLRGGTLLIRFGLVLLVARALDIEQAGLFFLYLAGVQIVSSLLPMDLYAATARALLRTKTIRKQRAHSELDRHFGAIVLVSIVIGPIAGVIFYISSPSVGYVLAMLFVVHIGLEAFCNDTGRLLAPLGRPLLAATYLFFRSTIWIIPAALLSETGLWSTNALGLAFIWFASSFIMAFIGALVISRAAGTRLVLHIDHRWLLPAVKRSFIFLLGTFCFRFVIGGDRFLVERALGLEAVAVYGFYVSLAFGLLALVETGSSAWNYPNLVRAIQNRDRDGVYQAFFPYLWQNTLGSIALTVLLLIGFFLLPAGFLDPAYVENTETFVLICLAVLFMCISLPFYYAVYGFGFDSVRLLSMVLGVIAMIIAWVGLLPDSGLPGAGLMLFITLGTIALSRIINGLWLLKNVRNWPRPIAF